VKKCEKNEISIDNEISFSQFNCDGVKALKKLTKLLNKEQQRHLKFLNIRI